MGQACSMWVKPVAWFKAAIACCKQCHAATVITLASSSATERSALKDRRRPPLAALRCRRPSASFTKAASQASAASLQKFAADRSLTSAVQQSARNDRELVTQP